MQEEEAKAFVIYEKKEITKSKKLFRDFLNNRSIAAQRQAEGKSVLKLKNRAQTTRVTFKIDGEDHVRKIEPKRPKVEEYFLFFPIFNL